MYVFGKSFFTERDSLDLDEIQRTRKIVWTTKPKVVNLCPYCRGILYSILSLPFVYLWRKFPHKKKKELTHEETMRKIKRQGIVTRSIGCSVMFVIGASNFLKGNFELAIIDVVVGAAVFIIFAILPNYPNQFKIIIHSIKKYVWPIIKPIVKFILIRWPKKQPTHNEYKIKNPSIIKEYIHSKHSTICPPICFIKKVDQEKLR